eukprot:9414993-Pyramimonas_sp.AAC.1
MVTTNKVVTEFAFSFPAWGLVACRPPLPGSPSSSQMVGWKANVQTRFPPGERWNTYTSNKSTSSPENAASPTNPASAPHTIK